jgi:hypothetical protein
MVGPIGRLMAAVTLRSDPFSPIAKPLMMHADFDIGCSAFSGLAHR